MILATHIESERGKAITKTANEFIFQEFTCRGETVGQIELYYFDDANSCLHNWDNEQDKKAICKSCGVIKGEERELGEWLIKFRRHEMDDWDIIAQGNL